jgi:hypothetical protein
MTVELNWLAIVVAAVAGYGVGAIWFMPAVFGNAWMNELGKTPEQMGSPAKAMGVAAITTLFSTLALACILGALSAQSFGNYFTISALVAIGIYGLTMISDSFFCGWTLKFVAIQAGYRVVMFIIIGVVLFLFR